MFASGFNFWVGNLGYKAGKLKFTEIQRSLGIEDATKLNFHMRVMKVHKIIEQDSDKFYMLTPAGKKLFEVLRSAEL